MALEGFLDLCTERLIAGWVWDRDHPELHIPVDILVDGGPRARVTAQQYREDLEENGIGDGTHAFYYTPPSPINLGKPISVIAMGADVHLSRSHSARSFAPLNWPPIEVDLEADEVQLDTMHRHVNIAWSRLGRSDPYWSVLTHPNFRADTFGEHKLDFFESGKANIDDFTAFARRSGLSFTGEHICFELGCGVGRLTIWLSPLFSRIIAADISLDHLHIAASVLAQRGVSNASFFQLAKLQDLEKLDEFDVFFSIIVFQHNPPPIMAYMLRTILGKLKPGGIGYFQIPTYSKGYAFNINNYLSFIKPQQDMEMHVLSQRNVIDIVYSCGCKLLEIREDHWTGDINGISNTFFVQKESRYDR